MHPTFSELVAVAASLCGGGGIVLAPKVIRSVRRRQAVHDRLLGKPAVTDKNGNVITPAVQSVFEELLSRPALNGQFNKLVADVAQMKQWTVDHADIHDQQIRRTG